MKIRVLGAHNCETATTKLVSLLIDDALALDAGGLTSSLHQHYDHIRDIPALGMNAVFYETGFHVYSTQAVRDALAAHWLNGATYSSFLEKPEGDPRIKFTVVEPNRTLQIEGYEILPVPVTHSVHTVGYQVTSPEGRCVFYTGDTGPGLAESWPRVSPQLIITEVTAPNRYDDFGRRSLHLTPNLLREELELFRKQKGYLPPVLLVHMNPRQEKEIEAEIAPVAEALGTPIILAHEGMYIDL
jgi:ribonuclease BN (tRNA processing enzyme)